MNHGCEIENIKCNVVAGDDVSTTSEREQRVRSGHTDMQTAYSAAQSEGGAAGPEMASKWGRMTPRCPMSTLQTPSCPRALHLISFSNLFCKAILIFDKIK